MPETFTSEEYLARITSEHNDKLNYVASVQVSVAPFADVQTIVWNLVDDFDLDEAVGKQLDAIGTRVGVPRTIQLYPVGTGSQDLTDSEYRVFLKARIVANHWDGTIPNAYEAYNLLFSFFDCNILIQSYGYMEMMVVLISSTTPSPLVLGLFMGDYLELRPNGVKLFHGTQSIIGSGGSVSEDLTDDSGLVLTDFGAPIYVTLSGQVFAWDTENINMAGWDEGAWVIVAELP